MFRINRRSLNGSRSNGIPTSSSTRRNSTLSQKSVLKRSIDDRNKLNKKITTQKINSFKRLTKENIKQLQTLRKIKQKQQLLNKNKLTSIEEQIQKQNNNKFAGLPQIPAYISPFKQQKTIEDLPVRKIQSQEDMAKVFNAIMNDMPEELPKPKQQQPHLNNFGGIQGIYKEQQKPVIQVNYQILEKKLRQQILDQKQINYSKYIQIAINLKTQFPKNNMIKSIILRAIDRYNRQQFYKIPDDKLKDLITIILQEAA